MPDESAADGGESLRERVSELEQTVSDQQETIQRLMPSRRQTVAGLGLLGAGVGAGRLSSGTARAEAAGQVGTDTDPVDVQAWDLDVQNGAEFNGNPLTGVGPLETEELVADNLTITQDTFGDISTHTGDRVEVDDDASPHQIFDVADPVDVLAGSAIWGYNIRELTVTWADDSTDTTFSSATIGKTEDSARNVDGSVDDHSHRYDITPIPAFRKVKTLEFSTVSTEYNSYGWVVYTK